MARFARRFHVLVGFKMETPSIEPQEDDVDTLFREKDKLLVFVEKTHCYMLDGKRLGPSVSGLVKMYWPAFDGAAIAKKCGRSARMKWTGNPLASDEALLAAWEKNGKDAAEKGTRIHAQIERWFLNFRNRPSQNANSPLCTVIRTWLETRFPRDKGWCFWAEKKVYGSPYGTDRIVPGTIDLLARDNFKNYWIFDWKRGEIDLHSQRGEYDEATGTIGTKYVKYSTQLALYAQILERSYGIMVPLERCRLVRTHEGITPVEYEVFDGAHGLATLAAALA